MVTSERRRFAAACAYAVVATAASIWLLRDAFVNKLAWALKQGSGDCIVNWLGARAFDRGIDPYSPGGLHWAGLSGLGHPPTTPLFYLPFTAYGVFDLTRIFGELLIVMLLLHFILLARELRAPMPIITALLGYALVSDTTWWRYHVAMIQVSEPIAFLYLLAWIFLRRRHDVTSGLMVGIAMAIKPYAALLLILFALGRRWRAATAAVAMYLLFAAISTWRFGFSCWREFATAIPGTQDMWASRIENGSIQGIVLRWWWPACGPLGPTLGRATALVLLLSILIVGIMAWLSREPLTPGSPATSPDESVDLPFAMFVLASAWMNPVTWEHYYVTLIQPIGIAAFSAWRLKGRDRWRWLIATASILLCVVLLLSIDIQTKKQIQTVWKHHQHLKLHLYEIGNWLPWPLTLVICGALQWRRSRRPVAPAAAPEAPA